MIALRAVSFLWGLHWGIEIIGYAAATGAIILVPVVAERLNNWPPVEWLQSRLPFTGRTIDPKRLSSADVEE